MHAWLRQTLETLGADLGVSPTVAAIAATAGLVVAVAIAAWIVDFVAKRVLLRFARFLAKRTDTTWDDLLIEHKVFQRIAQLAPAIVVYLSGAAFGAAQPWVERGATVYMIVVLLLALSALLDVGLALYDRSAASRQRPIAGYVQIAKIFFYLVAGIFVVSTLLDREPWGILTGLGALSAVLLLVFRDTILGFVASLQIAGNDMVRQGDWIEMADYGADGDVIEISLHTVKVQNWDKTISTIPTYSFITHSFRNWRGMEESGGRRIKRAVHIDLNTIRFCTDEMIERYSRFDSIAEYVRGKKAALAESNANRGTNDEPLNLRHLTNVGTFRAYLESYLRHHPDIHRGMTFLVRQLPPGDRGLPIEIYVFSKNQEWAAYEAIQADIFDHILAALPEFDLRPYQSASGHDVRVAAEAMSASTARGG